MPRKKLIKRTRRIVVKIGSSIITENGKISRRRLADIASDITLLLKSGFSVVIVSSGAISSGAGALQISRENITIPKKQALASVGQIVLMNEWRKCFLKHGYEVGQILLTEDDVKNRRRFINARHTFNSLLDMNIVPIVNENDSVVVKEIKLGEFGENDILSAHVANIVEADLLILLSDVSGFYNDLNDLKPVEEIFEINQEVINKAGGSGSIHGTGGMLSKVKAAEMIMKCGEMMIIANGREEKILSRIMAGENIGTIFVGCDKSLSSRKRWIAFNMKSSGKIWIDEGALKALRHRKKSLLSSGVTKSEGQFDLGDAVDILNSNDEVIGKGIVNYNFDELKMITGKKTSEIKDILLGTYFDEVVNRNDLILY
ncbi:MAG: glutamate 5-kinase [Spirochaetes bacterium]|nr:glutamate 5-kinase [Spirochaetota bacterium]